jgi:hypothetical protein
MLPLLTKIGHDPLAKLDPHRYEILGHFSSVVLEQTAITNARFNDGSPTKQSHIVAAQQSLVEVVG